MVRENVNFFCVLPGASLAFLVAASILNANCFLALVLRGGNLDQETVQELSDCFLQTEGGD